MKPRDYWQKRFEQVEAATHKQANQIERETDEIFRRAQVNLEKEINAWYIRYAKNNKVTMAEAKRQLNARELEELRWNVKEYIKRGKENAYTGKWVQQLERASTRAHITRLESLLLQVQQQAEIAAGGQLDALDRGMKGIYEQSYYRSAYEVQKGVGVGHAIGGLDERVVRDVVSKPWAADGMNFSDRVWRDRAKLVTTLHSELSQMLIRGEAPDRAIKAVAHAMQTTRSNAARIVQTEAAFFASKAQGDCFTMLDVEQYEIVATLDRKTSTICRSKDKKTYKLEDRKIGINSPPFHVRCRTTTAPYFADAAAGMRTARNEDGKTYLVPDDMSYEQWAAKNGLPASANSGIKKVTADPLKPHEIAGAPRGEEMTRDEANHGRPNPNFSKGGGYHINCQTCVVAYEARLRGYNVQALANTKGSKLSELSRATNKAWIDPATGKHPNYIADENANTAKKLHAFLEDVIEAGKRYTLEFSWKGRRNSGHIISLDRDEAGALRLYDPQISRTYKPESVLGYLKQLKLTTTYHRHKFNLPAKVLRVDDKIFNADMVNHILEVSKDEGK